MLEGVAVVLRVVIELVRISEEIASCAESITAADVRTGQADTFRLLDGEDRFGVAIQRFTYLVPYIRIGILIRNNLHRIFHACSAVIGCKNQCEA